jgi:hypothetical protein
VASHQRFHLFDHREPAQLYLHHWETLLKGAQHRRQERVCGLFEKTDREFADFAALRALRFDDGGIGGQQDLPGLRQKNLSGAFAYTAPVIDSKHRNRMVRGEPSRYARVETGVIELPPDFSAGYSSIFSLQEPVAR